jgi:hypothetical protein
MSRSGLTVSIACAGCLAGCTRIADLAAPDRAAAAILFYNLPDTLIAGDSTGAYFDVNDANGRPATKDTVVVWRSSDPGVVSLDASHPPQPTPHGFSWIYARCLRRDIDTRGVTAARAFRLHGRLRGTAMRRR